MGYGYGSEERKFKREIWELNTQIKKNKIQQQKINESIENIENIEYTKEVKDFMKLQLIPLKQTKRKLVEEVQALILNKISIEKALKQKSHFKRIEV